VGTSAAGQVPDDGTGPAGQQVPGAGQRIGGHRSAACSLARRGPNADRRRVYLPERPGADERGAARGADRLGQSRRRRPRHGFLFRARRCAPNLTFDGGVSVGGVLTRSGVNPRPSRPGAHASMPESAPGFPGPSRHRSPAGARPSTGSRRTPAGHDRSRRLRPVGPSPPGRSHPLASHERVAVRVRIWGCDPFPALATNADTRCTPAHTSAHRLGPHPECGCLQKHQSAGCPQPGFL
jgi:hypothetical protein